MERPKWRLERDARPGCEDSRKTARLRGDLRTRRQARRSRMNTVHAIVGALQIVPIPPS